MLSVVDTRDVPLLERFDVWREVTSSMLAPVDIRSPHAGDFLAEALLIDLGGPLVTMVTCPPYQAVRTARLIRRSDPESYQLSMNISSRSLLSQVRHTVGLRPQDLLLYDTSRPFEGQALLQPGAEFATGVMVSFPRTLLPLPDNAVRRAIPLRIPGDHGVGAMLFGFVHRLLRHAHQLGPADRDRMAAVLMDLVAAAVAGRLEDDAPATRRRRAIQLAARRFIREHLADPGLTPTLVAEALHISPRYLYQLFQDQRTGVAAWIRNRRLERCHRDLSDPLLADLTVAAIAQRWGLADIAHFSRAFRARYGITPTEHRHRRG
ncbi:helix-turn-helix domain-containing protein [Rhizohabitans arisaemae]|uniref:helix-turn-helix domain-containing protein n=1 Tax=Rhizohabitans arisaemae TaxID=2720610 RepID=UPI0024B0BBDB|nr:helix-turn-helix domain-containing protein [Rhizohabitans arisaemae]